MKIIYDFKRKRFIDFFSNYLEINSLHKRSLSKLTKNIVEKLEILYKMKLAIKEEARKI